MQPGLVRLEGVVRNADWGSHRVLARLTGRTPPTTDPEAELWFGTHPPAVATAVVAGARVALDSLIAADPDGWLGPRVHRRFGPRLPFLTKFLAVERALSLQVHPDERMVARAGDEGRAPAERAGGARPPGSFPDPDPKPEELVAVTTFEALCGLAPPEQLRHRLAALGELADGLVGGDESPPLVVARLLATPPDARPQVVAGVATLATRLARRRSGGGAGATGAGLLPEPERAAAVARLARRYPTDPAVAVAWLLQGIRLAPGQVLRVPPGVPHAYLGGTGLEVMAPSDNVIRAGLTSKPVDRERFVQLLASPPETRAAVADTPAAPGGVGAPWFEIVGTDVAGSLPADPGPRLIAVVDGRVRVSAPAGHLELGAGGVALLPHAVDDVRLAGGGVAYLVRCPAARG